MCGRYYMSDDTIWEIERRIGVRISQLWRELRDGTRDICPSQYAIILRAEKDYLNAEKMRWGFPDFQGKGLLINARAESALQKKTYRDSMLNRRCVIPAKGFYEWNSAKEKFSRARRTRYFFWQAVITGLKANEILLRFGQPAQQVTREKRDSSS